MLAIGVACKIVARFRAQFAYIHNTLFLFELGVFHKDISLLIWVIYISWNQINKKNTICLFELDLRRRINKNKICKDQGYRMQN